MKRSLLITLFTILSVFAQTATVKPEDLRRLTGGPWLGTLTYLDYRSNKEVSIPSNVMVTESNGDNLTWIFEYEYPKEPKAEQQAECETHNGRDHHQ